MIYECFICRQEIPSADLLFKAHASKNIVEKIEKKYKPWFMDDGICTKCISKSGTDASE